MQFKWDKIKINQIRKEAHSYLFKEFNGSKVKNPKIVFFYYYLFPIIIGAILCICKVNINKESSTYLITGISIFAGLFFNLLLVVAEKMSKRKKFLASKKEDVSHYAKLYKRFSEQLIAYISYAIILSLLLIILMFFTQIDLSKMLDFKGFTFLKKVQTYFTLSLNFLVFYFGYQFILILLIILSNMYIMLLDDINLEE